MIEIVHLVKHFGPHIILNDISVCFDKARTYGIVGPNGCGKTTLMRCICGFSKPTSGRVIVSHQVIGKDVDFAPRTGIILEAPGFNSQYNARKNLNILSSYTHHYALVKVDQAIRLVGLDPCDKKPVGKYSLGMRQRLGIAQAIMDSPEYLILDEPFNGLDSSGQADIHKLLQIQKEKGTTIILVSHNAADITKACDVVYEMQDGKLLPSWC